MRWSATKLRWLLVVGLLLLAGVLAGFFGLARYRAGKIWQRILARNGVNLRRDTDGVTWSQSSGGRTVFTLHASKATPEGNNRWTLHDAVLILYGREPGRDDRIYGKEFEYDQETGVARAIGEVHMDLQTPEPGGNVGDKAGAARRPLGFGGEDESAADPGLIHVRTSGLVYMRKLGIAATGEMAEFRYGGITCVSRGAEFDTGQNMVRLLAAVQVTGTLRKAAFRLTASHAELAQGANTANLTDAVMASGGRTARAAHALLHLHKDGSLQAAEGDGGVQVQEGTRTLGAPRMTAVFGEDNRPVRVRWFDGVRVEDADRVRPARGAAGTLELAWDARGELQTATAEGGVRYAGVAVAQDGAATRREAQSQRAVGSFVVEEGGAARRARLRRVELMGGALVRSANVGSAGADEVGADDLVADMQTGADGRPAVQHVSGVGHTRLEQVGVDGAKQRSVGQTLEADFPAAGAGTQGVSSVVQTGGVEVQSWAAPAKAGEVGELTTGRAARMAYVGAERTLTLDGDAAGRASVQQSGGEIAGAAIVLHQGSGDADANGGVVATSFGRAGEAATHVLASRARLLHEAQLSEFFGEAGRPAQLWQGGSQVQAAEITLDGRTHGLAARPTGPGGVVEAVFTAAEGSGGKKAVVAGGSSGRSGPLQDVAVPEAVRVSAARMDYDDGHHEGVFTGGVRMEGVMGEATAERGAVFLKPAGAGAAGAGTATGAGPDLSGTLDRMVLLGDVRLQEPGRTGTGEQLTYTAARQSFVLTGTAARPPQVTGENGSVVTGATMLFRSGESTIVVAGAKGDAKANGSARVHTETDLKQ